MKLVLYGGKTDRQQLVQAISALPGWCYRKIHLVDYADYDGFLAGLGEETPDCIIVAINGAAGMEGVIAARSICPHVPILWLSDDDGFGVQSYRLGCAFFHKKPVPLETLSAAIEKCV